MRPARSRRSLYGCLAEGNGTDESSDVSLAEEESEEGDDADAKLSGPRETSSGTNSGQYSKQSEGNLQESSPREEEDTEYQVQDDNDECCSTCGSKKDSDKLLCCELCPRVYHLYCLKSPLKAIPSGDWFCIHCQKILGLDHVEKFLASRTRMVVNMQDLEAEQAAEDAAAQQAAADAAARAKKRKTVSGKVPVASKKPKMASVQQLHTSEAADPAHLAHLSQSASSDKQRRGGSSEAEASSLPHHEQIPNAQPGSKEIKNAVAGLTSHKAQSSGVSAGLDTGPTSQALPASVPSGSFAADAKQADVSGQDGKGEATAKMTKVKEYFVKWKGKSYIHCSWVKHDDIVKVAKHSSGLNMRFKYYQRSVYGMPQVANSGKLEDQEVGEMLNGIDPLWVLVDRVVSQQEKRGLGVQFFVKWKGLGYEECTWEASADLQPKFDAEIARFHSQHPIANELAQRKASHSQASTSQADTGRSAAGRKVGTRKFADSPDFLAGGGNLHPYQLEGLNWLYFAWQQRKHVILADEMGLGKTIQSIAFLAALKEEGQVQKPHLVVVPLSTFPNWEREFALWAPQLNVVPFIGNQAGRNIIKQYELCADPSLVKGKSKTHSRHADLQARVKFHVLLTTYEMVGSETTTLRGLEYETLIVDEGHRLKNQQSKLFQQLHNFRTRQRTLLTGTPLQNNLSELWMLLHFLDASKFHSLQDFEADFSDFSHGDQIAKLHELLSPHLLRRLKKDVLKQLPPKKEQIVRVELSPLQKDWYRGILTKNFLNLTNGKQTGRLKSVMMELRKCCNHPFLIDEQEWPVTRDPKQFLQQLVQASGKLALIDTMLERMKDQGHRVLIYSQFTTLLDLLEEWLAARQWGYQRIDGSVGGAERQSRIDQFNRRPADNFVFLLSTKAGGLGINLASADTVIIYDSDWNPHNDLQAQARAHRLGQLKPVMIYRLVTRLTIEERMMQQTKKKMVLEHLVVHKMNTTADLKQDELDDILRYGAAELFADAVAASQKAQEAAAAAGTEEGNSEAAGGAGLASKSAADKADKLIRLSEREQAEGRTGGQAGQRIVYDDAAIERLLDRSDLANADEEKADEKEDNFVKGFKVANFEIIDSPDKGEAAEAEEGAMLEGQPSGPQQPAAAFWDELLKNGYQDLQQTEMAALGKGKRERRKVNYDEKHAKGRDDASDYSAQSDASGEESGDEATIDKRASKRHKPDEYTLTEAEAKAIQTVAQQRQASLARGQPLTSGAHTHYRVLGFTSTQRAQFMKMLMQFGLGQQLAGGKFDWSHIQHRMTGKWPPLALEQTCGYAELVMAQLSEPANGKPYFADGILKKEILQSYELNKVLDRLGTLHLVRHILLKQMGDADPAFSLGQAHAPTLRPFKFWKAEHDKRLLYGVLKHGWAQWQVILKDSLLAIEPVVRQELCMPPLQPQPPSLPAAISSQSIVPKPAESRSAEVSDGTPAASAAKGHKAMIAGSTISQQAIDLTVGAAAAAVADGSTYAPDSQPMTAEGPQASGQAQPTSIAADTEKGPMAAKPMGEHQPKSLLPATESADRVVAAEAAHQQKIPIPDEAKPKVEEALAKPAAEPVKTQPFVTDTYLQQALPRPVAAVKFEAPSASAFQPTSDAVDPSAVNAQKPKAEVDSQAESPVKPEHMVPGTDAPPAPTLEATASQPADAAANSAAGNADSSADGASEQAAAVQPSPPGIAPDGGTAEVGQVDQAQPQPVGLGCPKCRWAVKGCTACRAKYQNAHLAGASTGQAGKTSAAAVAAANSSRVAQTDRAALNKMTTWLMSRTSTLCTALKQAHQISPAMAQPQTRLTLGAPATKLLPNPSAPVITTQQTVMVRPGGAAVTSAYSPGVTPVVQTGAGSSSAPAATQWQQQAVQMSQFRQQQRLLQLAEAQRRQQQSLLLQQQQRQQHTSLLRQQHQTAQLRQQQQQAVRTQTAASSALHLQQQRMRQQQQQQGLYQQQLLQQQQVAQQKLLQQQQQQLRLSAQQQVQFALSRQSSQPRAEMQPRPAAVFASAAQHAQYHQQQQQQQAASQAPTSVSFSQPDKVGTPLLMAMHQQQAALRTGSTPSPSLPHQQPALSGHTSSPTLSLLPGQAQQEAMQQPGQAQQSGYQSRRSQQVAISPLDPAFRLLTDAEKTKRLREFLLGVKPNLQPLDVNQLLIASGRGGLSDQSMQDRRQLVEGYNQLCSGLLDVQVTLSQNKPQTMSDHDRNAAAAKFQNGMQEMDSQCARMVHELAVAQARSDRPSADPFLQPVLQGQGHSLHARASAAKPQTALPGATMPAHGSSGEGKVTAAGALHSGPSAAPTGKGSAAEPKGSLASLIAPAASKLPAALRQQPAPGATVPAGSTAKVHLPLHNGQMGSPGHSIGQVMPNSLEPASSIVGIQPVPKAKMSTSLQQGQASLLKPAESIDLTAESDEEAG